ncbi:MAG: ADP-ribosylglycohydrolase family protein [Verrucomicrobiota bacterium JB023]|nr:ADP-ribosylglycohydrolase family protein [Verrucomicrobiota bacterium JB023]
MNSSLQDKALGCLLGLAIGDALGTTLEFRPPGSFPPIDDLVGGGPFNLRPGQWTDDTSMALCLAESLIESGFDARDQMTRYLQWRDEGHLSSNGTCFDIGMTVSSALRTFEQSGEPYSGSTDPYSAGNGSIMRLAPLPIYYAEASKAIHLSGESSRTTHQAPAAIDACRYLGSLLWGLVHGGASREQVLAPDYHPQQKTWQLQAEIARIAAGSFKEKEPPAINGSGYVVESLEAALWAFNKAEDFRHGALLAVNLGDDADTTGAIYGQLAGAYFGLAGIPGDWLEKLAHRPLITDFALKLIASK